MDGLFPVDDVEVVERPAGQWGDWRLGDLSDALRRVADVLGPSAHAGRVHVYPPTGLEELPCVQLTVEDELAVQRLRRVLSEGEHLPHFTEDPFGSAFQAEVNDVHLDVSFGGRS